MGIHIGRHTYAAPDIQLRTWAQDEEITIGSFCSIADQVVICAGGRHRTDLASTFPFAAVMAKRPGLDPVYQTTRPTAIGNDVWIGARSMIMGGVHIGHGAVISAGAVVFSDVPPYAIVAGNPAKVLRYRISRPLVDRILQIAWWDWPDERIRENEAWFERPAAEFVAHFEST